MASRREEKYLLTYSEYSRIAARIRSVMQPDVNGIGGEYSICSLYFDDRYDTALDEKESGLPEHIKFRIRTYSGTDGVIKLERKTKRGIVTEKSSIGITRDELAGICSGGSVDSDSKCFALVTELRSRGFYPVISVRYDREAFWHPGSDVRVTFDKNIDALSADTENLFGAELGTVPAVPRETIIMEIKYGEKCPSFVRKCCSFDGMQLSVSKYALCRAVAPK